MAVKGQAAGQGPQLLSVEGNSVTFQTNMPLKQLAHNSDLTSKVVIVEHMLLF